MTDNQPEGIKWSHPAFLIATWFGVGKIPWAPGTFGSLAAFPLFVVSHYLLLYGNSEGSFVKIYCTFLVALFFIGQWASNVYMRKTGKEDPGEVVIDEVVGQIIVWFLAFSAFAPFIGVYDVLYGDVSSDSQQVTVEAVNELFSNQAFLVSYLAIGIPAYFVSFVLFRIFDIWKPWPIKWCDRNIKHGFGVMFDDLFASVYAVIALFLIVMIVPMVFSPPEKPQIPESEIVQ